jgi:hypothetical protein
MYTRTARRYPGYGKIVAVHVKGTRYGLRENGNPDNPALNPRAVRRNLRPSREQTLGMSPLAMPSFSTHAWSMDDFEPMKRDFSSDFVSEGNEAVAWDGLFRSLEPSMDEQDGTLFCSGEMFDSGGHPN